MPSDLGSMKPGERARADAYQVKCDAAAALGPEAHAMFIDALVSAAIVEMTDAQWHRALAFAWKCATHKEDVDKVVESLRQRPDC